jgi:hypothetical protein
MWYQNVDSSWVALDWYEDAEARVRYSDSMSGEKPVVVPEDTQVGDELLAVLRRFIREEMRS